ncbi:hypothetical protein PN462_06555 [Spirulina sp. CS-785/01]|uniref:hypothetical protein n=1 Tax=Spirulina sp. CS-785/01 TaxID=3021716 RepID=UPI00232DDEAD|nr:hypothetical protein [Spirulina sp. CS-785/01]MDB9312756.1 hypothetical protein [Spirulina sp. CS-785/01]
MFNLTSRYWIIPLLTAFTALPVIAQSANFDTLHLAQGFDRAEASVTGNTGGAYDLAKHIASEDYQGNRCLGFGSQTPDHMMVLEEEMSGMTLSINSGGHDTTLVVQGPDGVIRCGDDSPMGEDAQITDQSWASGEYKIWVGSLNAGQNWRYRLSARE